MIVFKGCELMPVIIAALERGQSVRLTVSGSSMLPFIRGGDVVEIEGVHSPPRLVDVVLARFPEGTFVVHRVVRIEGDTFFVRGDAQRRSEGPIMLCDILGKVTVCRRGPRERVLGRGIRHLVELAWIHSHPLGSWLLDISIRIMGVVKRFQRAGSHRDNRDTLISR
jgi:signal peptidase I